MIADSRAASDSRQPEVKEAWFAKAGKDANAMNDEGERDHPSRAEDEEQFGRDHGIGDKPAIRDAREHLWARQRHKHRIALEPIQRVSYRAWR